MVDTGIGHIVALVSAGRLPHENEEAASCDVVDVKRSAAVPSSNKYSFISVNPCDAELFGRNKHSKWNVENTRIFRVLTSIKMFKLASLVPILPADVLVANADSSLAFKTVAQSAGNIPGSALHGLNQLELFTNMFFVQTVKYCSSPLGIFQIDCFKLVNIGSTCLFVMEL